MTRDELLADLARTIAKAEGFISPGDDGHDVARAVLDRLEQLGWRKIVEPTVRLDDGQIVVRWPPGDADMQWAYISRPLLDDMNAQINAARVTRPAEPSTPT